MSELVWASLRDGLGRLVTPAELVPNRREFKFLVEARFHLELQSINEACEAHVFMCGALVEVVTADLLSVVPT